jgi:hypothetical protein
VCARARGCARAFPVLSPLSLSYKVNLITNIQVLLVGEHVCFLLLLNFFVVLI